MQIVSSREGQQVSSRHEQSGAARRHDSVAHCCFVDNQLRISAEQFQVHITRTQTRAAVTYCQTSRVDSEVSKHRSNDVKM